MDRLKRAAPVLVIIVGVALIAIGLLTAVPGDHLTTYKSLASSNGYFHIDKEETYNG